MNRKADSGAGLGHHGFGPEKIPLIGSLIRLIQTTRILTSRVFTLPIDLVFVPEYQLLHARCSGRMTAGDAARAYKDFLDHPAVQHTRFVVSDFRTLDQFDIFFEAGRQLADMIAGDSGDQPTPWNIALLLRWNGQFPLARHLAMQIEERGPARCRSFTDLPLAIDWMGADRAVLDHRLPSGRVLRDSTME